MCEYASTLPMVEGATLAIHASSSTCGGMGEIGKAQRARKTRSRQLDVAYPRALDVEDGKVHEAEVEAMCAAATCLRSCRGRRGTEGEPRR